MALRLSLAELGLAPVPSSRPTAAGLQLARLQAGDLGGTAAAVAGVGGAVEQLGQATLEAERQAASLRAKTALAGRLRDAELAANGDAAAYRKAAGEAMAELAGGLPDDTSKRAFQASAEGAVATRDFNVRRAGLRNAARSASGALTERLSGLTAEAAEAANPAQREVALRSGAEALSGAMEVGAVAPERAAAMLKQFLGDADEFTIQRQMGEDPAIAAETLEDRERLPNLDPQRRHQLLDTVRRRQRVGGILGGGPMPEPPEAPAGLDMGVYADLDREFARVGAEDDRQVVQQSREMEADAAAASRALTALREGQIIEALSGSGAEMPADLDQWRDTLPPALMVAAKGAAAFAGQAYDDADAMALLRGDLARADPSEFRDRTAALVAEGRLKPATMVQLLRSNEAAASAPAHWQQHRRELADALDTSPLAPWLGGMPEAAGVVAEGMAELDRLLFDRGGTAPHAMAADALGEAVGRIGQRRLDQLRDMATRALPQLPGWGAGPYAEDALTMEEMRILDERDAGALDDAAAGRALALLAAWRFLAPDLGDTAGGRRLDAYNGAMGDVFGGRGGARGVLKRSMGGGDE